jgi:hypothetical protein
MATQEPNAEITRAWDVYVPASSDFTLSMIDPVEIEWRATDAATPIEGDISGHALSPFEREGLTRALSGPGYLQLRIAPNQSAETAEAALTYWTP